MAFYLVKFFDRNGKLTESHVDKTSGQLGRWKQYQKLDKKAGIKETYRSRPTRSKLNRVVTHCKTLYPDGTSMTASLISNSSKMPKKKSKKYPTFYK